MLRLLLLFPLIIFEFSFVSKAQADTSNLRISLLTCTPGEDLYSTFGHSALRIIDSSNNEDIVYNYGTFNFDEPGFYMKFIRGKLMYYLSTENLDSFKNLYKAESRGITEQVLNLTRAEKIKIKYLLQKNLAAENRLYKYDFLFDNCTTRLRDIVEKTADTAIIYGNVVIAKTRFRQLIYEYLDYNDKQWSKLGIDLLLGSKTDATMMNRQVMFLPDYLMKTFSLTKIGQVPLVVSSKNLYTYFAPHTRKNFITHPELIFSVLFLFIAVQSFSKNDAIKKIINGFDGFLFFVTGIIGVLILFMWFGTDHIMCSNNFNLLWAWPTHAIFAFYNNSGRNYIKTYFRLTGIINSIILLIWFFLPQHMNVSLIPVVMLLIFRSAMISYNDPGDKMISHGK